MKNVVEFLDWLVDLDIQHYKTESMPDYKPSGASHFYLSGSLERFTSKEMVKIYENKMSNELNNRWKNAVSQHSRWKRRNQK